MIWYIVTLFLSLSACSSNRFVSEDADQPQAATDAESADAQAADGSSASGDSANVGSVEDGSGVARERNVEVAVERRSETTTENATEGQEVVQAEDVIVVGEEDEEEAEAQVSEKERSECADRFKLSKAAIKINGNQTKVTMESDQVLAIKMNGNKSELNLTLKSALADAKVAGLCIFMTGNLAHAKIDVGLNLENVYFRARGNQAHLEIIVGAGGTLGTVHKDMNGNQPKLSISGVGTFSCEDHQLVHFKSKKGQTECVMPETGEAAP